MKKSTLGITAMLDLTVSFLYSLQHRAVPSLVLCGKSIHLISPCSLGH